MKTWVRMTVKSVNVDKYEDVDDDNAVVNEDDTAYVGDVVDDVVDLDVYGDR